MDISSLAKVTDGYSAGNIVTAITQILTERRIQQVLRGDSPCYNQLTSQLIPHTQLRRRPLTAAEFIPALSKMDPIYQEEEEAYKVCH